VCVFACFVKTLLTDSQQLMDEMTDNSDTALETPQASRAEASADEASDLVLVNQARQGDEAAFEELFNRHRRRVSLIASRFFRQREQIEEVVQESFTKAYFALSDFSNTQDNSFAAWLARISFNACYDELRRMKRRPESTLSNVSEEESEWLKESLLATGETGGDIETVAIARDLATKLLSRLSPEDRLVLVMLDAEGMSVAEIAKVTGWSAAKVKVRAHRARASLRKALKRFL
jgi:RNA polymerase sigma-70 factor (ECF subfamily)